jgi:hypothetical protein
MTNVRLLRPPTLRRSPRNDRHCERPRLAVERGNLILLQALKEELINE